MEKCPRNPVCADEATSFHVCQKRIILSTFISTTMRDRRITATALFILKTLLFLKKRMAM